MIGRRASHLNPVRMYVFASALFFLIFFSLYHFDPAKNMKTNGDVNNIPIAEIAKMDSTKYKNFIGTIIKNDPEMKFAYNKVQYFKYLDSIAVSAAAFKITPSKFTTHKQYDSALASGKDHNWIERQLVYKQIELNEKYKGNPKAALAALINTLLHSIPQILFISLPLFAFLLKLLYSRHRQYYYVNHAIFTIHLFVFVFIALLFIFGINKIEAATGLGWLGYLSGIMTFLIFFYNYKAMRNFYQQKRGKTIIKFLLLHFVNFFIVVILFVLFTFLSLFKI